MRHKAKNPNNKHRDSTDNGGKKDCETTSELIGSDDKTSGCKERDDTYKEGTIS